MPNTKSVTFHIDAPEANSVAIAGDFNDWNGTARPLRRRKDGIMWWVMLRLNHGLHQYKFVIDGTHWREDPTYPNQVTNDKGTVNSVREVA